MLNLFRRKQFAVKALLAAIVGIVGLSMVAYLGDLLLAARARNTEELADPQGILARVGEDALTQQEVQQHYQRAAERLGTQSGPLRQLILEQLVQELITQRVMSYEAERLGLGVTPEEVSARRRRVTFLYPGGQFVGMESYRQIVQREFRMSVPQFEETLREQALQNKLYLWVSSGVSVSATEVEQEYRRRQERVQVDFVLIRPDELARGPEPGDAEVQAYFQRHQGRYQVPARRAVRYVAIDYASLRRRLPVSRAELEDYYLRFRESYQVHERVKARHILFLLRRPGEVEAAESPAAVRKKAEQVMAELRRGKDFAALARQYSDDATTRERGGEVGWVQRGQTVPALEQALFSLTPGGPEALVETSYGFHVAQVLEYERARLKPIEEVRAEIEAAVKEEKVRREAPEEARRLVAAVRAGKSLAQAAQEMGWPVLETPLFKKDEPFGPFGESRDFQEAAFSLPPDSAGQPSAPVSDPVAVAPGYAVLQLTQDSPAHPARLEEVRAEVLRAYQQERGAEQAREAAQRLAAEADRAGGLRAAAKRLGRTLKSSEKFGREGFVPELGAAREVAPVAFGLPVGGRSPALPLGGNWLVFEVAARQEADPSRLTEEEKKAVREWLLEQKRNLAWNVFTESAKKRLQAEGQLKLNQRAIDRLTGKGEGLAR